MITPGIRASLIDINGPNARRYNVRDTVFVSITGKDTYLGHSPNTPVKTYNGALNILSKIKTDNSKTRYLKFKGGIYPLSSFNNNREIKIDRDINTITDAPLVFESVNKDEQVVFTENHKTYTNITVTENGLWRIPIGFGAINSTEEQNIFLNDKRIFPAKFPKKGAYMPGGNTNRDINSTQFRIIDDTTFIKSLSTVIKRNGYGRIAIGGDYNVDVKLYDITAVTSPLPDIYILTCPFGSPNAGISIIPYKITSTYIVDIAHHFCTVEGEFVIGYDSEYAIYVKPYSDISIESAQVKIYSNNKNGFLIDKASNIKINDISFRGLYCGVYTQYGRNISLSGCKIEKCSFGVSCDDTFNLDLRKNIIFDNTESGVLLANTLSSTLANNIINSNGLVGVTSDSGAGIRTTNGAQSFYSVDTDNMPIQTANLSSFTLLASDIPLPVGSTNITDQFVDNVGGYIEVTSGDFIGQKRIVVNNSQVTDTNFYKIEILDYWTPVGEKTFPDPGDTVRYIATAFDGVNYSNKGGGLKIINNYLDGASYGPIDIDCSFNNIISGNYVSHGGYGFSNDFALVRHGFSGYGRNAQKPVTVISNNILKYCRSSPLKGLAAGIYIDEQNKDVFVENNIIDTTQMLCFLNGPFNLAIRNNYFLKNANGIGFRYQVPGAINTMLYLKDSSLNFHVSSYNNIFVTTSSAAIKYDKFISPYSYRPAIDFFYSQCYAHPLRIIHSKLDAPDSEYYYFKAYHNKPSSTVISGLCSSVGFIRGGVKNNYPVYYYDGNNGGPSFNVQDSNWVYMSAYQDMRTSAIALTTSCGLDGYRYPWLIPASEWKTAGGEAIEVRFDSFLVIKREVPLNSTYNNCYFTDITGFTTYNQLSTNSYSFLGGNSIGISGSRVDLISYPSYADTYNSANNPNLVPLSAGLEILYPWEANSIFSDPKIDYDTYALDSTSPVFDIGIQEINTENIGLYKDDPEWLSLAPQLTSHPIFGDTDWSEFTYSDYNIPQLQVYNTLQDLKNNSPAYDNIYSRPSYVIGGTVIDDGGQGIFDWDPLSNVPPDDYNYIERGWAPGSIGRWIRRT